MISKPADPSADIRKAVVAFAESTSPESFRVVVVDSERRVWAKAYPHDSSHLHSIGQAIGCFGDKPIQASTKCRIGLVDGWIRWIGHDTGDYWFYLGDNPRGRFK